MTHLKTNESFKYGQKNIIPYAGEVLIGHDGVIEVDDSIAQQIVDAKIGFDFLEKTIPSTLAEETTTTTTEEATTTTTIEVTSTTTQNQEVNSDLKEQVEGDDISKRDEDDLSQKDNDDLSAVYAEWDENHTLAQLKELAKDYPSKEWRNLDKAELIKYLVAKQ